MLVILERCPKNRLEDFMTSSNEFYAFHWFADLQSSAFFEKSLWTNILNHFQTKVTLMNPRFCIFSV